MDSMTLGERICMLREKKGLLQKDLAELLDVKANTISNWETGISRPNAEQIVCLCGALAISADVLLGIDRGAAARTLDVFEQQIINAYRSMPKEIQALIRQSVNHYQRARYSIAKTSAVLDEAESFIGSFPNDLLHEGWKEHKESFLRDFEGTDVDSDE